MTYSFTEKKRIRKSFAKRASVLTFPSCWPRNCSPSRTSCRRGRRRSGKTRPAGRVYLDFPDRFAQRQRAPGVRQLHLGEPAFDVRNVSSAV